MKTTIVSTGLIVFVSAFNSFVLLASPNDTASSVKHDEVFSTCSMKTSNVQVVKAFDDGSAIACENEKFGIVSDNGNWLIEPKFEWDANQNGFWISVEHLESKQVSLLGE